MCREPSWWTWNPAPWTAFDLEPSVTCSDPTTSSLVSGVLRLRSCRAEGPFQAPKKYHAWVTSIWVGCAVTFAPPVAETLNSHYRHSLANMLSSEYFRSGFTSCQWFHCISTTDLYYLIYQNCLANAGLC